MGCLKMVTSSVLQYAHENGCPWDKYTCLNAAENGHLECLKYAHENGCPWDEGTCKTAAKYGHLKCLKYAHENGVLGMKNLFFGCRKWSTRVFEIRTRKRMSLG